MKRNRIDAARNTLEILDRGNYTCGNKTIDISEVLSKVSSNTILYQPDDVRNTAIEIKESENISFEVRNETTLAAIQKLRKQAKDKIGVLNFASAKNPGGGFLGGAQAQEESLARSSSLYKSLMNGNEMYAYNRSRRTYLYSDYMIYSGETIVFKNDDMQLLEEPIIVDILTSPAVNLGAIRNNKPSEEEKLEATMLNRTDKVLSTFYLNQCKTLVLGAWGCGVFGNDPVIIAEYFAHFLNPGGKFHKAFKHIRFAVLDTKDSGAYRAFKEQFDHE